MPNRCLPGRWEAIDINMMSKPVGDVSASVKHKRILVVQPSPSDVPFLPKLPEEYELTVVNSVAEALCRLKDRRFDAVVSAVDAFVPTQGSSTQSHVRTLLETIGEGICIVDHDGKMVWCNRAIERFDLEIRDQVIDSCKRALEQFTRNQAGQASGDQARVTRRFSLSAPHNRYYEVIASPVLDRDQLLTQVAAVVVDQTSARTLQLKMDAIDMAGRELVRLEGENIVNLNVEQRLQLLEEKIFRYTRDLLHFDHFMFCLLDRKRNKLEPIFYHGFAEGTMNTEIYASSEGNGITGYVAATGRSYICPDTGADRRYLPGLPGARSSLTVPLRLHDKVIGTFNVESDRSAAFNEDDRQFAEIFGRYAAVALNILDLLAVERHTTTGQLADNVGSQIAGPLNDILFESTTLMEDYIGHDDMRHRLQSIVDSVAKVRDVIKEVAAGASIVTGKRPDGITVDPVLAGKQILVADDERMIRRTISEVLTQYGCEVETATDGRQAAEFIEQKEFDVVLSDIKMPYMNGYEIFAAVKDRGGSTAVILMTGFGYDPNHSIVRARQEGLSAVLFKPFKVDQLIGEVRKAALK